MLRQINQIFEDKVVADETDDNENNPRTSLPEFLHEHFIAKSVAKLHWANLISTVDLH